jgi:phosphatidylserine synthase
VAALFIVLTALLFGSSIGAEDPKYYFTLHQSVWVILAIGFLAGFLMASEIPYPKIHGWMAGVSVLAVLMAVLPYLAGLALVGDQPLYRAFSRTATAIALAFTVVYVLGGPMYERVKGNHS